MTHPKPPPRLLETLTDDGDLLRVALEEARAEVPDERQLARLRNLWWPGGGGPPGQGGGSEPPGVPPGAGPAGTSTPPYTTGLGLGAAKGTGLGTAKALGVAGVAGAAVALLAHFWYRGDTVPAPATGPVTVTAVASEHAAQAHPSNESAEQPPAAPPSTAAEPTTGEPVGARAQSTAPSPDEPASAPAAHQQPKPSGQRPAWSSPAGPGAAGGPWSVAPTGTRGMPSAATPAEIPTEIELLREAQASAGSQPARALALVAKAALLYPNGALVQEREMIRIQVLAASGRWDEARAEAVAFRKQHPGSPYCRRLETLFANLDSP